ncbi:OmpA family protein [Brevundimonas sp. Leaf363]|uniref:OmpA family protein n=1 Tax=Brevundimonas sp. Leaf363 TaxID=1736353 RepID=UPI0009EA06F5|nr:OmpA family protein [Brevundimonas sp. Leaf363]
MAHQGQEARLGGIAEPDGWYGAIDGGYHKIDDLNLESSTTGVNWNYSVNNGWAAFGRLGYRFNPNWRVELEGGYRSGDIGKVRRANNAVPSGLCNTTPARGACYSPDGEINSTTVMANVIYDFGWEAWGIRPFVGLGAGVNHLDGRVRGTLRGDRTNQMTLDDSNNKFAAQAIAGLAIALGERANIDLTYRYLTSDAEFNSFSSTTDYGVWEGDYDQSHTVTVGLRYPPPPPPPVVNAPRQFVVYFDWDRSDLTAEARSVVTQAANYAKSGRATRVLVVGHADTSGSAAYNIGLSNRRSRTVADALVAQGVNGGVIALDGKGETQLARATADGVREPLNRRATIDINF